MAAGPRTDRRLRLTAGAAASGILQAVTAGDFLELLARDATPVEFEEPLLRARAAGASADELAALEEAKLLALRVRTTLQDRKRREVELVALYETAADLASLRDLDAVLSAIVRRARTLLGTDVTYMTLVDEDAGDTYMRVTEGSVSARFQAVRLPMGAGLGGLVAETRRPYATASYADDSRFRHTGDIDAAVTDEGLVAILGVPMLLGQRAIGVLFAANRAKRPFARAEVALLASLADFAAIAIDNARRLDETRAALADLSAANQLVSVHSRSVERAAEAHDRFFELVLHGGDVQDVAQAVAEVLDGPLVVVDQVGELLATVGGVKPPATSEVVAAFAAWEGSGHAVHRRGWWYAPVAAGADRLGAMALSHGEDLDQSDVRVLERGAMVTALLLLLQRSTAEAEQRVRGELLDDLLGDRGVDPASLRERARRVGLDLARPYAVVVARSESANRPALAFAAASFASRHGGIAGAHNGGAVLLLPAGEPGDLARAVAKELSSSVGRPVTAGGAGHADGPTEIVAAYRSASQCVDVLDSLGRQGDGASARELGFVGLLLGDNRDVATFVEAALGPVLSYDAKRGTELVRTLEAYFGSGGSPARAATALQVHVNTVTQRLDRVARLLGPDWSEPERALEVQLALRLHRVARLG